MLLSSFGFSACTRTLSYIKICLCFVSFSFAILEKATFQARNYPELCKKNQFVPRSKHSPSQLHKPSNSIHINKHCYEIHKHYINAICGQKAELLNVKPYVHVK